jgi:hypothetical protein
MALGLSILAHHYANVKNEIQALSTVLTQKAAVAIEGMDRLEPGMPMSQIPGELGQRLRDNLLTNHRYHGFASEDEAAQYIGNARIRATNTIWGLSGAYTGSNGGVGAASKQIPPP